MPINPKIFACGARFPLQNRVYFGGGAILGSPHPLISSGLSDLHYFLHYLDLHDESAQPVQTTGAGTRNVEVSVRGLRASEIEKYFRVPERVFSDRFGRLADIEFTFRDSIPRRISRY